jgi:hypothetical protein
MYWYLKTFNYICGMEMLTAKQIADRTGEPKTNVDRWLKNNLATISYEQVTKSIKRYNVETLPVKLKEKCIKKSDTTT